jgi:hypothetical protein
MAGPTRAFSYERRAGTWLTSPHSNVSPMGLAAQLDDQDGLARIVGAHVVQQLACSASALLRARAAISSPTMLRNELNTGSNTACRMLGNTAT